MHIRQNPCRYGIRLPYWISNCHVKGGYINIDRNKAVIQGCRLYVHFTQYVDICLLDVFAQGIPDYVKTLTECFGGRNRIGDA